MEEHTVTERVRIGILGCGNITRRYHLPQYPKIPEGRVVALYDTNWVAAETAKELLLAALAQQAAPAKERGDALTAARCQEDQVGITVYERIEQMLEQVDAVDIATPPIWHGPHARMALERGLSVMVEKPMARTWWEAAQISPVVHGAKGFYQHNENWIYNPAYQLVRGLIEGGAVGRVQRVQWFQAHTGPDAFTPFWFSDPQAAGGGSLTDWGVHSTCCAWYLAGFDKQPTKVRSDGIGVKMRQRILAGRLQRVQVEDDALLEVTLTDPASGSETLLLVEGTWSRFAPSGKSSLIRVEGTRGEIEVEGSGFGTEETVHVTTRFAGERSQHLQSSIGRELMDESFLHEIRNFVVCVAQKQPPVVSYDIGLTTMAILGAGYLSEIRSRQAVTLEEFQDFCAGCEAKYPREQVASEIIRYLMSPYAG